VAERAKECEYVGVLCVNTDAYDELLPNGVHAIGMNYFEVGENNIISKLEGIKPTHIICCYPSRPILKWTIKTRVRTLPLLADSFETKGLRSWFRNYRLKNLLNHPHFDWVANHNLNASLSLKRIGVDPKKIIAWDFPAMVTPDQYPSKIISDGVKSFRMLYVGNLIESKGVGDCIEAIKHLKEKGLDAFLTVAGPGDAEAFRKKSHQLLVESSVKFLGRIGHDQVIKQMIEHDIVLVPSWHDYPEGLPMTIYEGFCSHTPLVVSDHPMFAGKVNHCESGMVFRAKDIKHFAEVIEELMSNPTLYETISNNAKNAWFKLQIPVKWDQLLTRWLRNSKEDREWFRNHCLSVK